MPFVFVHGVNTRDGEDYQKEEKVRNAFLREIVGPAVGVGPTSRVYAPYWGNTGVKFWRGLSVIPERGGEVLGIEAEVPPSLTLKTAAAVAAELPVREMDLPLAENVVDSIFDFAVQAATPQAQIDELAAAYAQASRKARSSSVTALLGTAKSPSEAAEAVYEALNEADDEDDEEVYGGILWDKLSEGAKRLTTAAQDVASQALVSSFRAPVTHKIATFMGDAFVYLSERGDGSTPGPIASLVLKDLKEAQDDARQKGEPLIVICHSFGGEIVYDILTHYATDLQIDVWVTVGSQVALFEEMSLYLKSPGRAGAKNDNEAIAMPSNVKRWLNVADINDILSFDVTPVFTKAADASEVEDYLYDTGLPVNGAHSGYFIWPSFYRRLASRLTGVK